MSVQSQINRISGNITAALTALAEKGVDVPAGSTSDALAGLIAGIEAGGGGLEVITGEFTPAEDVSFSSKLAFSSDHNFTGLDFNTASDSARLIAYWYSLIGETNQSNALLGAGAVVASLRYTSKACSLFSTHTTSTGTSGGASWASASSGSGMSSLSALVSSTSVKMYAGLTYNWYVVCLPEGT